MKSALLGHPLRLLVEVGACQHPRDLEHPPQLHLAPGSAHGRDAQRRGERGCLVPDAGRRLLHATEGLTDRGELVDPVPLELLDLELDAPQGLA